MRKLIIIDHSHTGKSIINFVKLINKCIFKFDEINFCNLVDNITPYNLIVAQKHEKYIKYILLKQMV